MEAKIRYRGWLRCSLLIAALLVTPWNTFGNSLCDTPANSNQFAGQTFTENNVRFTLGAYFASCTNNTAGLIPANDLVITPVSAPHFAGFTLSVRGGIDFQASPFDPTLEATQITDLYFSVTPLGGSQLTRESASISGAFKEGYVTSNAVNWQFFPGGPPNGTEALAWEATLPDGSPFVINPAYASLDGYGTGTSDVIHSYTSAYLQTCVRGRTDCNANGQTDLVLYPSITVGFNTTPEPSSLMLLSSGLVGVVGAYRRRRKSV